jgi:hypothetical protein
MCNEDILRMLLGVDLVKYNIISRRSCSVLSGRTDESSLMHS